MNKTQSTTITRMALHCILCLTLITVSGCGLAGFIAHVVAPEQTAPVYDLPVARTVVLVDDTNNQLGDPTNTGVIAQQMLFDLVQSKKLTEEQIVDYKFVRELEAKLDKDFDSTPVDQIGKSLGADIVIHVNVDFVEMSTQPGIIEPKALVTLKVIDVNKAVRLFPEPSPMTDIDALAMSKRGYRLAVELPRTVMMDMDHGTENLLRRKLAEQIGYDAARMFYKHPREEDGKGPGRPGTKG